MRREKNSWFVCQTNAREEKRARYFLEEKGFEVYLPMMETHRAIGSKAIGSQRPLFPNYLFVRFNGHRDLHIVRWTQGVRQILPDSVRPLAVEHEVVGSIRALADDDGLVRNKPLKKRDRVRVVSGPFMGLLGIFDNWISDQGRVGILLQCINYQARLEIHHSQVVKAA